MTETSAIAEALERAAEVIEERGWCQNKIESPEGNVCLVGAVKAAAGAPTVAMFDRRAGDDSAQPVWMRAVWAVEDRIGVAPADFNDYTAKDKYEVIDLLKSVAKDLRNGESI